VNFAFSPEEESFRLEVREFLRDYRDLDGFFLQGHKWKGVKALFRELGARGWLALTWPEEWGGLSRGPAYEYILWDEVAYARAARNPLSSGIVANTLLRHGSEAQKARWLPPIRSGELHFSLAYSEPEAGSDLAALRTRAELCGDVYIVSGQKCWQSYAQDMDCFWLLCRTGAQDSRSAGLALMIVEKAAPGVTVRALPTLDGDQLNEVHFDQVEIPVEQRIGPEDGAWKIMGEALADERHIQFPPGRVRRDLEEVVAWLREAGRMSDPVVRHRLAALAVRVFEAEMHSLRVLDAMLKGRPAAVEAAANKVVQSVLCQDIARAAVEFGGEAALADGARPALLWRQSLWETIGGGTSEIMRSVVARQGLGLGARR
jgi:alkylation response protein AidB-like acyl-CoA dehydrogenase